MKESLERTVKKAVMDNTEAKPITESRETTIEIEQRRIRETVYLEYKCNFLKKYMTPEGIKLYFLCAQQEIFDQI